MPVIPTGTASRTQTFYPQLGQGTYLGKVPGSSNYFPYQGIGYSGGDRIASSSGLMIQTDGNVATSYISTLSAQPQNVLRITGASGAGYIQGENIRFSVPFSGAAGVAILPSTGTMNVGNLNFVSTLSGGPGTGVVNMLQLISTIAGNNWAQVL